MAETRTEAFGRVLKEARIARGMSQDALGLAVGVSGTMIGMYEKGTSEPKGRDVVVALEDALGIPDELLPVLEYAVRDAQPPAVPAALSGKLNRLTKQQQRLIERMVDEMLDD